MRRQLAKRKFRGSPFATPGWSMPSGDRRMNRFCGKTRLPYNTAHRSKRSWAAVFVLGCASAVNRPLLELALPISEEAASHDWWLALCAAGRGPDPCDR